MPAIARQGICISWSRNQTPPYRSRCWRSPRECDGYKFAGLSPSEHTFGLAKHAIPDTGIEAGFRDHVDLAVQTIFQEVLERDQVN